MRIRVTKDGNRIKVGRDGVLFCRGKEILNHFTSCLAMNEVSGIASQNVLMNNFVLLISSANFCFVKNLKAMFGNPIKMF